MKFLLPDPSQNGVRKVGVVLESVLLTYTNLNNQVVTIYKNLPVTPSHSSTIITEALLGNNVSNNIDKLLMTKTHNHRILLADESRI